jgi:hypothetical protein
VCSFAGTYLANSSTTYQYVASNFNISYVDGSGASGDYVKDTVTIGSSALTGQQFGIGYSSSSSEGILGIGYRLNEVWVGRNGLSPYDNVPANMVTQGLINSNAYSLWLNDLDASTGSILFGGVDTAKFSGTLATLPIQSSLSNAEYYAEFLITLTGLTLGSTKIASNARQAVLLDSGSSLTYLPNAMTQAIYNAVGAQYDSDDGAAFVPCSLASSKEVLSYTFTSTTISVTMRELVIEIFTTSGKQLTFSDGTTACLFGIAPAGSGTCVLGDTFLRSAYVVYDMANNQISLAQTNFNATNSNVLEITTGSKSVPSATSVQNAATATVGPVGNAIAGTVTLGVGVATSTAKAGARNLAVPVGAMLGVGAAAVYASL